MTIKYTYERNETITSEAKMIPTDGRDPTAPSSNSFRTSSVRLSGGKEAIFNITSMRHANTGTILEEYHIRDSFCEIIPYICASAICDFKFIPNGPPESKKIVNFTVKSGSGRFRNARIMKIDFTNDTRKITIRGYRTDC
jgi:hypothetical protein